MGGPAFYIDWLGWSWRLTKWLYRKIPLRFYRAWVRRYGKYHTEYIDALIRPFAVPGLHPSALEFRAPRVLWVVIDDLFARCVSFYLLLEKPVLVVIRWVAGRRAVIFLGKYLRILILFLTKYTRIWVETATAFLLRRFSTRHALLGSIFVVCCMCLSCWSFLVLRGSRLFAGFFEYTFGAIDPLEIPSIVRFDFSSSFFIFSVVLVGSGALLYSVDYMSEDSRLVRFLILLLLFTFFIVSLVVVDSLLVFFVVWELIGLVSFFLINFWNSRIEAGLSAQKAVVANRICDLLWFAGLLTLILDGVSSFTLAQTIGSSGSASLVPYLLACASLGKSAQLGFHGWWLNAMEGPTPVSALMHAATLVTAGAVLLVKFGDFIAPAFFFIFLVGAFTSVVCGAAACAESDIKAVIAYSTAGQIGFVFMLIGAGNSGAAWLHLSNHAIFKALLFFSAGLVIHTYHNQFLSYRNISAVLPVSFLAVTVSSASLLGTPISSGFFTKELIVFISTYAPGLLELPLIGVVVLGQLFSVIYNTRLLIFFAMLFFDVPARPPVLQKTKRVPFFFMQLVVVIFSFFGLFFGWFLNSRIHPPVQNHTYAGTFTDGIRSIVHTDGPFTGLLIVCGVFFFSLFISVVSFSNRIPVTDSLQKLKPYITSSSWVKTGLEHLRWRFIVLARYLHKALPILFKRTVRKIRSVSLQCFKAFLNLVQFVRINGPIVATLSWEGFLSLVGVIRAEMIKRFFVYHERLLTFLRTEGQISFLVFISTLLSGRLRRAYRQNWTYRPLYLRALGWYFHVIDMNWVAIFWDSPRFRIPRLSRFIKDVIIILFSIIRATRKVFIDTVMWVCDFSKWLFREKFLQYFKWLWGHESWEGDYEFPFEFFARFDEEDGTFPVYLDQTLQAEHRLRRSWHNWMPVVPGLPLNWAQSYQKFRFRRILRGRTHPFSAIMLYSLPYLPEGGVAARSLAFYIPAFKDWYMSWDRFKATHKYIPFFVLFIICCGLLYHFNVFLVMVFILSLIVVYYKRILWELRLSGRIRDAEKTFKPLFRLRFSARFKFLRRFIFHPMLRRHHRMKDRRRKEAAAIAEREFRRARRERRRTKASFFGTPLILLVSPDLGICCDLWVNHSIFSWVLLGGLVIFLFLGRFLGWCRSALLSWAALLPFFVLENKLPVAHGQWSLPNRDVVSSHHFAEYFRDSIRSEFSDSGNRSAVGSVYYSRLLGDRLLRTFCTAEDWARWLGEARQEVAVFYLNHSDVSLWPHFRFLESAFQVLPDDRTASLAFISVFFSLASGLAGAYTRFSSLSGSLHAVDGGTFALQYMDCLIGSIAPFEGWALQYLHSAGLLGDIPSLERVVRQLVRGLPTLVWYGDLALVQHAVSDLCDGVTRIALIREARGELPELTAPGLLGEPANHEPTPYRRSPCHVLMRSQWWGRPTPYRLNAWCISHSTFHHADNPSDPIPVQ